MSSKDAESKKQLPGIPIPMENPEIKFNKMFIANNWIAPKEDTEYFSDINPDNEELITKLPKASKSDVDQAVAAATDAFNISSPWRQMDSSERAVLITKLADLIDENKSYLASLESLDSGKPFLHSFYMDTTAIAKTLRYFAGWADKIRGSSTSIDGNYLSYTLVQPVGVCALILPWNVPLISLGMKLAPALAAGNTVVIKPDENTSLTALYIASLALEAGFPPGVINVITGDGETGEHLVKNEDVKKISFTGSLQVGRKIEKNSDLRRSVLELSGNCPMIVFDDVPIDSVVQAAYQAVFTNQGQMCTAASRIYVHEKIYDEFVEKSVNLAKRCASNLPPFHLHSSYGPMINKTHMEKILKYVEYGIEDGATLELGGKRREGKGFYVDPIIFSNVSDEMRIAKDEIFGPIQCFLKFKDLDDVIQRANNTHFGLAAGIYIKNADSALEIAKYLESGTVWINCYNAFAVQSPFGGLKKSGIGKEMGKDGIKEFCETKTVTLKLPKLRISSNTDNNVREYKSVGI